MSDYSKSERNTVRRLPTRGSYDRETVFGILDAGFLCHVGFSDGNQPFVIPTLYARDGDSVMLHGSAASRLLGSLSEGIEACITVTHVDGIVLARSAFNHSINYRSVVVFGRGSLIENNEEKLKALELISENTVPGRFEDCRGPSEKELRATSVIRVVIDEASAKIRTGDPIDDKGDLELGFWAGTVPIETRFGNPRPAGNLSEDIVIPGYIDALNSPFK